MDSPFSSASRFRFRDDGIGNSTGSDSISSDISDLSSEEHELHLQSMTGKGIKRLCSELLDLKRASDEDFHRNIFSNYYAFVRIFGEVRGMEDHVLQLKHHMLAQKRLVKDFSDGICLRFLSKEGASIIEEAITSEASDLSPLDMLSHADCVSDALDTLLSEYKLQETLAILEKESLRFQSIQLEENYPPDVLTYYAFVISEKKALLGDQFTLLAENPRISAAELQQVLIGHCRLGNSHLANQLLLSYYSSRINSGICRLRCSKSVLHGIYIYELAKFIFSMISQAAKSFRSLHGEISYISELVRWARKETKVFVSCFDSYVKSISEVSGGLFAAVEAVNFALSFCSLLENQRIVLQPCLIKNLRPCMEEVLQIHVAHFKKVIGIFTATDSWVLSRYLISGIMNEGCSSVSFGQPTQYCMLTNSGRKFVRLLQTIMEDISPLFSLQMESSIFKGLGDLFSEYIDILERAITGETEGRECGPCISLEVSCEQQVAVLANLSTLAHLFSNFAGSIFQERNYSNEDSQWKELNCCTFSFQEACSRVRLHFFQQFISKILTKAGDSRFSSKTYDVDDSGLDLMPSVAFQAMFFELKRLEKLGEGNVVEVDWLMELLGDLLEANLVWTLNNKEIWMAFENDSPHSSDFKQISLDIQFLIEIAKFGGYCTENIMNASTTLLSHMESVFLSAGIDPKRDTIDGEWAVNSATQAIQKLQEFEKTNPALDQESVGILEESNTRQSDYASDSFEDDSISSLQGNVESDDGVIAMHAEGAVDAATEAIQKLQEVEKTNLAPRSVGILQESNMHESDFASALFEDDAISSIQEHLESDDNDDDIIAMHASEVANNLESDVITKDNPFNWSLGHIEKEGNSGSKDTEEKNEDNGDAQKTNGK